MKINNAILGTLMAAGLTLGFGVGAQAQAPPQTTVIANVASATTKNNTQFTNSASGDTLVVTYNDGVFSQKSGVPTISNVLVNFTATGGQTTSLTGNDFKEVFSGGTFSAYSGATDLLSGSFSAGKIQGTAGDGNGGFVASGVIYDTGSTALPAGDSRFNGLLNLTYDSIIGGYTLSPGGKLQTFTATDAAVYSAVPGPPSVPEVGSIVPFALGGLGLLGLIVRKTRRTNGAAA